MHEQCLGGRNHEYGFKKQDYSSIQHSRFQLSTLTAWQILDSAQSDDTFQLYQISLSNMNLIDWLNYSRSREYLDTQI